MTNSFHRKFQSFLEFRNAAWRIPEKKIAVTPDERTSPTIRTRIMARRTENGPKTDLPDSDQSARQKHAQEQEDENWNEVTDVVTDLRTSNKSGKHSTAEKLSASRPEFGDGGRAQHVDGASGSSEEEREDVPGHRGV
jgi:hypothetical protein